MLDEKTVTELKAKHGDALAAVEAASGTMVFKKPSRLVFDKWRDAHHAEPKSQSANARELAQACLVVPTWGEFTAALEAEPALLMNEVLEAILLLSGTKNEYDVKKL